MRCTALYSEGDICAGYPPCDGLQWQGPQLWSLLLTPGRLFCICRQGLEKAKQEEHIAD